MVYALFTTVCQMHTYYVCNLQNGFMFAGFMQEIVLEVDVQFKFQLENMRRKLKFDLSRLSILSRVFLEIVEKEIQISHFSVNDACSSRDPGSEDEYSVPNSLPEAFRLSHIVKHAGALMSVEMPLSDPLFLNEVWVGSGSISGFDITISLSQIQVSKSILLWLFLHILNNGFMLLFLCLVLLNL